MLELLKCLAHSLYRIWFYLLVGTLIFLFIPFLLTTTVSSKTYPQFYWLARNVWARPILLGMLLFPSVRSASNLEKGKSYILVANHTSMIDIMLMLHVSNKPFVFVGKKELEKIPIFGFFYRRVCILVDRNNANSRSAVYKEIQKRLKTGLSICIFPEGGVPNKSVVLDNFKDGAFRIALQHNIPIVPMTFLDCKKCFPWDFFSGSPGILRVIVHPLIQTVHLTKNETKFLKEKVWNIIHNDLINHAKQNAKT